MKEILFLGFFNFCVKLVLFMGRHQLLPLPRGQDSGTFYNFIGVIFEIPGAHPRPPMYRGSLGSADTCSTLEI